MKKGYLFLDTEVFDWDVFAEFAVKIAEARIQYGGRALARGGRPELIAGDWEPHRIILMEFDSFEAVQTFVHSPEYTDLQELRDRCQRARIMIFEGQEPEPEA